MTSSFKKVSSPISTQGGNASLKAKLKAFVSLLAFLMLGFVASTRPLAAQAIDVTTSDDLNAAISTINTGAAAGSVQFMSNSIDLSTLTSPLGTFKFDTTLQDGTGTNYLTLTNSTLGATASLNSTAKFILSPNYSVTILGAGSFGQDSNGNGLAGNAASLSAGSLSVTSAASLNVNGGEGSDSSSAVSAIGGNGGNAVLTSAGTVSVDSSNVNVNGGTGGDGDYANGGNGGNATASIGSNLNLAATSASSSFSVIGGGAGDGDDCCQNYGVSGAGGSATLTVGGIVSMDSSQVTVMGGAGSIGWGHLGLTDGPGGDAWFSSNGLVVTSNSLLGAMSNVLVEGGAGGYDDNDIAGANSGNGGNAGLAISGAVSVDSSGVTVLGGDGGSDDNGNAGNGGNGWVSVGSLTMTSDNYYTGNFNGNYGYFEDYGGNGAPATYGNGGNGGNATFLSAGAVSLDSAGLDVEGEAGGYSYYSNGGNGGNGLLAVNSSLTLTSTNHSGDLYVYGGNGGDNKNHSQGVGGNGGTATLLVSGAVSIDSTNEVYVDGGTGGHGDGSAGTTEGSGGNAYASMASLSLTSENKYNGNFNGEYGYSEVGGGTGGYEDYLGNGGNGGNASLLSSGAVSIDSAELNVYGGDGGYTYGGNGGNGGNALLSAGNLTLTSTYDTGYLYVTGGAGDSNYDDYDYGVAGSGGNATLLANAVSIDSADAYVTAGSAGEYGYGKFGQTEGSGGNALVSLGSLTMTSDAYFEDYGGTGAYDNDFANGGNGGNATFLSSGAVSLDSAGLDVEGGDGGYSEYANGGNGGNGLLVVNSNLTLTSTNNESQLYVYGGEAGYNDDSAPGVGGNGGSATLMVSGAVSIDSTNEVYVDGGSANSGYGSVGAIEGSGGNAYASMASLSLTSTNKYNGNGNGAYSYFYVDGGTGGYEYELGNAGNGGNASLLVSGAVSVDSAEVTVYGGIGAYSEGGNGGNGGNALLSAGTNLTLTSTYSASYLGVIGGYGDGNSDDNDLGVAGNGGNATLTANAVSMDASYAYVEGGNVGYYYDYGYGKIGQTEGSGGNGLVSVGTLTLTTGTHFYIEGGSGASDDNLGNGGNGGNATLTANAVSMDGGSYLEIDGESAGSSSQYTGGNGGNAVLTSNSVVLNHNSGIYLDGGDGGSGNIEGNDGNALVSINSLNLVDSLSYLDVYGGDSTGLGGVANVTIGALNGAGSLYVYSYNHYGILQVSSGNFSGVISGDEILEKTGTGTLTLTGANTYSGGTSVLNGTLAVGSTNALSNGDVAVEGGILATSGGPSVINVGGNYTQGGSGILQLGLAGTAIGQYDTLSVSGATTLGGMLALTSYNGFIPSAGQTFALVNSVGALNGQFAAVGDTFFQPVSAVYSGNQVDVITGTTTFAQLGSTSNDANIGAALDAIAKAGSGANPALSLALTSASTAQLQKLYNQLSPASLTSLYQMGFSLNNTQSGIVSQHLAGMWGGSGFGSSNYSWNNQGTLFAANLPASDEAAMANEAQPDRWGVFVNGIGSFGTVTGTTNAPGYQFSLGGTTAGVDYRFSKDFVGGLLLGYSSSGTTESNGSVNQTGGQVGVYGGWKQDALHIEALAEGGLNSYTTQRDTVGGTADGSTQGLQLSGQLGAGYDFKMDQAKLGPFVTAQYTNVAIDAFQESGSDAPLSYGAQSEDALITDLGAQASRDWDLGGGFILSPQISAAWEHLYQGNLDSLSANFGTSTGGFSVNGPAMGTDGVAIGAGVNAEFSKGFNVYVQYQGVLAITNYDSQDFGAGLNFGF